MDKEVEKIKNEIAKKMDTLEEMPEFAIKDLIKEMSFDICFEQYKNAESAMKLSKKACDEILGLGPIQNLYEQEGVTEIMINGEKIYYEKAGLIKKANFELKGPDDCMKIIRTICRKSGRTVNASSPITDACLDDGTRINIVLSPVSVNNHSVTIRKFPEKPITGEQLISNGFCSREALKFLKDAYISKYNIFICGGAGTGKTTLLNVLANYTGAEERIITIEDSAELRIDKVENIVRLETRMMNTEGKGEIGIRDLIRTSLRMRPDRIIVGEVRGGEALDMLQAMNTGHEGSISTGHANSPVELISRLETMVLTGQDMPLIAVRKQIATALDIVICISKPGGKRKITEICEVCFDNNEDIYMNSLYKYDGMKKGLVAINEIKDNSKFNKRKIN